MQVFVERGASKGDCLDKITKKYGIYFTLLRERAYRSSGIFGLFAREGYEVEFCLVPQRSLPTQGRQSAEIYPYMPNEAPAPQQYSRSGDGVTLDFAEAKKKVLIAAGKDPDKVFQQVQGQEEKESKEQLILDKLNELQEKIETEREPKQDHPSLIRIAQMLRQNDFSDRYTSRILDKARKELPLETLEDFDAVQNHVLIWIGESVSIYEPVEVPGRIMVLVGPTGVGKTTTIAKLAAIYNNGKPNHPPPSIRMITIDAYQIGAQDQIGAYGDIMEIPVSKVDNRRDLRREIDLYRDETDLILVDTIGNSPRDSVKLGEMKELLDACGSHADFHLVMSASIKTSDIEHILRQFEPFNYQAVVLTKLDETRHVGNVISALAEKGKPVSFITDGQKVPKDIKKATVLRFLINLDGFRVDREEFEKRFPAAEADQFQWG